MALNTGKVIILFGARQVGITTLVKKILQSIPDSLYLTYDEPDVKAALEGKTSSELKQYYQKRIEEGKPKMVALNIIRNKIVSRIFATVKRGTPFLELSKFAA